MPLTGFITGLASEADCLAPHFNLTRIRIAAMRPDAAERGARELVAAGCDLLVSFGLAGALVASVSPGAMIVASAVATRDGDSFATDPGLSGLVRARVPGARALPVVGSDEIVASTSDKLSLNQLTGACAVDMESHRVARIAREHGIPFVCIRAVADRCGAAIPRAAFDAIDCAGRPRVGMVLTRLAQRPWDVFGIVRLAAHSRAAHRSLRDVAPLLLDVLGR